MMLLEMAASGFGERVAVQNGEHKLSYAELFRAAGAAADEVRGSGCTRLAVLDVSSLAVPIGLFGSAWAGVPFVPLNYRLTGAELDRLAGQIAPSFFVTDAERVDDLARLPDTKLHERDAFVDRTRSAGNPADAGEWPMDPDDIAILLFTSGTTGPPKAAVLRHKHLVSYILTTVEFGAAAEGDASLMCVPPYHIAAMAAIASSVYSGRRIVQLPAFTPEAWLETARREQVTNAFVVPTMLSRIVDALEGKSSADLPSLHALAYGGGKMPLPVIEKAMALFPDTDFTNAYGLTETSSTISVLGPDDHRQAAGSDDAALRQRLTSVGRPISGIEVQIRDDEGRALPAGEHGEIYVRGEQVSGEYLGRGSSVDTEGWFPTRDGGYLDADGYLFLEGRVDDIIVRGGENMSPGEIEDVLLTHPAVRDSAVIGVPDVEWGEAVAAVVVLRPDEQVSAEELQDWVRERMRSSRTPSRIEFRDALPYNEMGKLLRRKVREDLAGDLS